MSLAYPLRLTQEEFTARCQAVKAKWQAERQAKLAAQREANRKPAIDSTLAYQYAKYGLTREDYTRILSEQHGHCAICQHLPKRGRRLCIDHNHATGQVRGLLCDACNYGLGGFQDNPDFLLSAIAYLRRAAMLPSQNDVAIP